MHSIERKRLELTLAQAVAAYNCARMTGDAAATWRHAAAAAEAADTLTAFWRRERQEWFARANAALDADIRRMG